jgi:hypothetical protein
LGGRGRESAKSSPRRIFALIPRPLLPLGEGEWAWSFHALPPLPEGEGAGVGNIAGASMTWPAPLPEGEGWGEGEFPELSTNLAIALERT